MTEKRKHYEAVLFDLDGTLTDSGPGIMKSVQYALDHFGIRDESVERLRRFVGPSLVDSFMGFYGMSLLEAEKAVSYYREVYPTKGIFDAELYPGMRELLSSLKEEGRKLVLVTSKPLVFAERILDHFSLTGFFDAKTGTELSEKSSRKAGLIERAIELCSLKRESAVMVGDTRFDIDAARETGLDSIGVCYGYGGREELIQAGATYLSEDVEGLRRLLLS